LIRRLADVRTELLEGLRRTAAEIRPAPVSLVLFGSFARGDASAESDLDVLAVRPRSVLEGDDGWTSALAGWTDRARRLSGNAVNLVEVGQEELRNLLRRPTALWREIAGDGILLFGSPLVEREVGHGG
ncbi:MAG: nucleotidyltransferase domain-containing protein, partial [Actinobacteria bacterium]|nr:nucleotidyltransferase domain-containing protein [Actinomycetota bacterium]